jgi:NAD+ kinase
VTATLRTAERVRRAAVVAHESEALLGDALDRLRHVAEEEGVELADAHCEDPDLVLVLGGDGTMLRALRGCLAAPAPVVGINFGRVGFLTTIPSAELEAGARRVFRGELRVVELCTLSARLAGARHVAVNDVVATSSVPGRMIELGWEIGGEDLGAQPCDGIICSTPTGSTAYNLSNGGPVMMWGLDAMAITFVAPHSLDSRPIVVPRALDLRIENRTKAVPVTVLVDGQTAAELGAGDALEVGLAEERTLLGLLPEVTFFSRYHSTFV